MAQRIIGAVIFVILSVSIAAGYHFATKDPGMSLGTAISPPANGECEVQVIVSMIMATMDPPPPNANFKPDWPKWLDQHLNLQDAQGNRIQFRKGGLRTAEISEMKTGTAEFIALAKIKENTAYTLEYTPIAGEPKKYIRELEGKGMPFKRITYKANY